MAEADIIKVKSPLSAAAAAELKAGDLVELTGVLYTARDQAHRLFVQALENGDQTPIKLEGLTIYYAGPAPGAGDRLIGSIGPTTAARMDVFTPRLLAAGVRALIGKGDRSPEVAAAIKKHQAVYFAAVGGAAAYLSRFIKQAETAAWPELGPEAVYKLQVINFPVVVAIDSKGVDIYRQK